MPDPLNAAGADNHVEHDDPAAYAALCARAAGTNVNDVTLLATDYFNHFNEVIMLIGMVPDMPEILEEARAWEHISYVEHFEASSIADRDLAIEAYAHVPHRFKDPFEATIDQINTMVDGAITTLESAIAAGDDGVLRDIAMNFSQDLQRLVDIAGAIVHGSENVTNQSEIDSLLQSGDETVNTQAEIDSLFDDAGGDTISQADIDSLFD